MCLIILILIGPVPTGYALNRALSAHQVQAFVANSRLASDVLGKYAGSFQSGKVDNPRVYAEVSLKTRHLTDLTLQGTRLLAEDIRIKFRHGMRSGNVRNDISGF